MPVNGSSQQNPWFGVSIGLIGLIAGYVIGVSMGGGLPSFPSGGGTAPTPTPTAPSDPPPSANTPPKVGVGPTLGKGSAKVTIVEFTDFQCPFCARHFTQTFGQIKTNYIDTGKVKYESRNFPLSFHQNAQISAEAAMCANKQGKFWAMHEALFKNQTAWANEADPTATFKGYAQAAGLNTTTFENCLKNKDTAEEVKKDAADGGASGVSGTPGFWLVGPGGKSRYISGAQPYANFQAAIDAMLE